MIQWNYSPEPKSKSRGLNRGNQFWELRQANWDISHTMICSMGDLLRKPLSHRGYVLFMKCNKYMILYMTLYITFGHHISHCIFFKPSINSMHGLFNFKQILKLFFFIFNKFNTYSFQKCCWDNKTIQYYCIQPELNLYHSI